MELESLSKSAAKGKFVSDDDDFFAQARQYGLDECEIIESDAVPSSHDSTKKNKAFRDFSDASRDIFHLATEGGDNRQAYFVATQDDSLADALRDMPYVPLFRLGRAVLLLESPSSASRRYTSSTERSKLASAGGLMTSEERQIVNIVKKKDKEKRKETTKEEKKKADRREAEQFGVSFGGGKSQRKKKRAGGNPNPLSCKKKKTA